MLTTNNARLTPYAKNPTTMAPTRLGTAGSDAPTLNANVKFTTPATSPLTDAIQVASVRETLRVKLLSMPHAKQAPSTANAGQIPAKHASTGQLTRPERGRGGQGE